MGIIFLLLYCRSQPYCNRTGGNYLYYINEIYKDTEDSLKIFFELCDEFFGELHSENNIQCINKIVCKIIKQQDPIVYYDTDNDGDNVRRFTK